MARKKRKRQNPSDDIWVVPLLAGAVLALAMISRFWPAEAGGEAPPSEWPPATDACGTPCTGDIRPILRWVPNFSQLVREWKLERGQRGQVVDNWSCDGGGFRYHLHSITGYMAGPNPPAEFCGRG